MKNHWKYILLFLLFSYGHEAIGQQTSLPKVFLIGEHEDAYEKMINVYDNLLLTVCNNSMDEAYNKWSEMLIQIEHYADSLDYDIKGVKIWINIFWNKEGRIEYIVYYPKPNSKNMDFDRFTSFLKEFIGLYQMKIETTDGFSHYGSASFPTHSTISAKNK